MVDNAHFVTSIFPRPFIGSFKLFVDIYFSKSVCISACWGYQVNRTYCQVSLFLRKVVILGPDV